MKFFPYTITAAAALHEPLDRNVVQSQEYQGLFEQYKALKKECETTQVPPVF